MNGEDKGDLSELTIDYVTSKPEIVQMLQTSRNDINKELEKINNLISQINEEYSTKIRDLQNRKNNWEEVLVHIEALLKIDNRSVKQATTDVINSISITDSAFDLLQQIHQPTHYKEITTKLQERNIHIPGKNPSATLLSRISRDKRFKRAKTRGVYALSTWRIKNTKNKRKKHKTVSRK